MTTRGLYQAFRRAGHGSERAAALTGYALLAQGSSLKSLGVSRHQIRRLHRALAAAGITPDVSRETLVVPGLLNSWPEEAEPPVAGGKRHGVLRSGSVHV